MLFKIIVLSFFAVILIGASIIGFCYFIYRSIFPIDSINIKRFKKKTHE